MRFIKRWIHLLFRCPTFWRGGSFNCIECGKRKRCYWDGNDIEGVGINICHKCAKKYEQDITVEEYNARS